MLTRWTPESEKERLFALQSTRLLDTTASVGFDRITRIASRLFSVPVALVTLIDAKRQWFKSAVGLDIRETPRADAFCDHTIRDKNVMVIEDALLDARFQDNPLVTGPPYIRFYAGAPLIMQSGHALGALCIIDVVPRRFSENDQQQLNELSAMVMAQIDLHRAVGRIDEVTGQPNRSQLRDDLQDLCTLEPRSSRTLFLIEVLSHGELLEIGNAIGMPKVEQLLRDIARSAVELMGHRATGYHIGLARFASFFIAEDRATEDVLIKELIERLRRPIHSEGLVFELHPRAGLVTFELVATQVPDVIRKAMVALQHATRTDQASHRYFLDEDASQRRSYDLLHDLPAGLARGDFRLVFQPKFNKRTFSCKSVEALLRWEHPQWGAIAPGEFIPLVESTALIHAVTEYVLDAALRQLAAWRENGIELEVAVNVSSRNLAHAGFVESISRACERHAVPVESLQIECTENAALTGTATVGALHQIRAMGVQVALDDFGVGYCNLASVQNLPAQTLKIDQSMIQGIENDPRALAVLEAIVSLAKALGYRLLAEGVETAQVFDQLVTLGFEEIQGYYYSRPLEASEVVEFLRQRG